MNFLLDEDSGTAFAAGGGGGAARTATPPAARRSIMSSVAFADALAPEATLPQAAPTPQNSLLVGAGGWNPYAGGAPLYMPLSYPMLPPAYFAPPTAASVWDCMMQSPPGLPRAAPAGGPSPPSLGPQRPAAPPAAPRAPAVVKPEAVDETGFLAQPQHEYVCGVGSAAVPSGESRHPYCSCARRGVPGYVPGLHATWDCPKRFIKQCGRCPGFRADGSRDPACWLGDHLTPETRSDWVRFLKEFPLPLPHGPDARSPNF